MFKSTFSGLQVTTLLLTMPVYLHSFSSCCLPKLRNPVKFRENSILWPFKVIQGHRSWCQWKTHVRLSISH